MTSSYALSDGRYARMIGESAIIMDTINDQYICFAGRQATWFAEIAGKGKHDEISQDARRFADRLCERGILTKCGHATEQWCVASSYNPSTVTSSTSAERNTSIRLSHLVILAYGFIRLYHLQDPKRRNLPRIFASVERWKFRAKKSASVSISQAATLSNTFLTLTPWFFSSHEACFFRSLLLIHFLAHHGVSADWTFGVRMSPFRAHCWIAFEGVLLNEDPDVAAGYHPILTA